jgi:Fe-S-cluster containining protein
MQWLYFSRGQLEPALSSPSVDCDQCQVRAPLKRDGVYSAQRKCCEFSPFLSSFAVGALIEQGVDLETLFEASAGGLILTKLGMVHSFTHRKNPTALCHFYNPKKRNCHIWKQRPAICYSFFCAHEKKSELKDLESRLLEEETALLHQWYLEKIGDKELWAQWGLVMEEVPLVALPRELLLSSWFEAEAHYIQCLQWLRTQTSMANSRPLC